MKHVKILILSCMVVCLLCSCSNNSKISNRTTTSTSKSVNDVLNEKTQSTPEAPAVSTPDKTASGESTSDKSASNEQTEISSTDKIDIDLTNMSSDMVYAQVYDMVNAPNNYKDKVIKMEGTFTEFTDDKTGSTYYTCLITDAMACCQQGMEFKLASNNYPKEGDKICVVGTYDTYYEGQYLYCTLRDAKLVEKGGK